MCAGAALAEDATGAQPLRGGGAPGGILGFEDGHAGDRVQRPLPLVARLNRPVRRGLAPVESGSGDMARDAGQDTAVSAGHMPAQWRRGGGRLRKVARFRLTPFLHSRDLGHPGSARARCRRGEGYRAETRSGRRPGTRGVESRALHPGRRLRIHRSGGRAHQGRAPDVGLVWCQRRPALA